MTTESLDVSYLKRRIAVLERLAVGAYCLAVGVVIIVGLFTPFLTEHVGQDNERSWLVLNYLFNMPTDAEEGPGPIAIVMLIGFVGLLLVTVLILFAVLLPAARGALTQRWIIVAQVLTVLGLIGTGVVLLFTLTAMGESRAEAGAGGVLLLAGMLALFPLLSAAARPLVVHVSLRPEYMR